MEVYNTINIEVIKNMSWYFSASTRVVGYFLLKIFYNM